MKNIALISLVNLVAYQSIGWSEQNFELFSNALETKHVSSNSKSGNFHPRKRNRHQYKMCHRHKGPTGPTGPTGSTGSTGASGATGLPGPSAVTSFGSFYTDQASSPTGTYPQPIYTDGGTNPSATGTIFFYAVNSSKDVTLSDSKDSIIIPTDGNYQIQWNATVSPFSITPPGFSSQEGMSYQFDLQKTHDSTTTILGPSPQQQALLSHTDISPTGSSSLLGQYLNFGSSIVVPLLQDDQISVLFTLDIVGSTSGGEGAAIQQAEISAVKLSD